jgi:cytochrome d ubiquinol oxidase subunit II
MEIFFYALLGACLIAYSVSGGADFGAGILDLFASGRSGAPRRQAIEKAIGPIWEANHVWLIFMVVILFSIFPRAFSALSIALHIPITLALIGIVLRGSAFVFRAYGMDLPRVRRRWGWVFGISSVLAPFFLGLVLGATATDEIRVNAEGVQSGFFAGWLNPFAITVGLLTVVLFSLLASVYLSAVTQGAVRDAFKKTAFFLEAAGFAVAMACLFAANVFAPAFFSDLVGNAGAFLLQGAAACFAGDTAYFLFRGRYGRARIAVAMQVATVVLGYGVAMDGALIRPDISVHLAGARAETFFPIAGGLALGMVLLLPSLFLLFRVFAEARANDLK